MKKYRGIRYGFRPASYWSETDPLSAILRNVTGENRRRMIIDFWNAGRIEELDPALLSDEAPAGTVARFGRIHPSFMGGEYLPPYRPGEVEIARICLQSTTSDVVSLRARPIPEGIGFRIVDEYRGEFTLPITSSPAPLTLGEMVRQFEDGKLRELDWGGGLATGYNNMNAEHTDFEELRGFTRISSRVYRQLEAHFEHVFDDWLDELRAERNIREIYGKSPPASDLLRLWIATATSWEIQTEFERTVMSIKRSTAQPNKEGVFDEDSFDF